MTFFVLFVAVFPEIHSPKQPEVAMEQNHKPMSFFVIFCVFCGY